MPLPATAEAHVLGSSECNVEESLGSLSRGTSSYHHPLLKFQRDGPSKPGLWSLCALPWAPRLRIFSLCPPPRVLESKSREEKNVLEVSQEVSPRGTEDSSPSAHMPSIRPDFVEGRNRPNRATQGKVCGGSFWRCQRKLLSPTVPRDSIT